jgi:outer membrane protein assembly factor BamD (BamD/ComL family)
MKMDKDLEAPCVTCNNYSNWVTMTMYKKPQHGPQTLQEAIDDWYNEGQEQLQEDFWTTSDPQYDVVSKPKHYMLFEEEGIEVRDVIAKLVDKMPAMYVTQAPLFISDYVQMMQYLMRFMDKNGVEDLKKARWYLDKLIDSYDKPDF